MRVAGHITLLAFCLLALIPSRVVGQSEPIERALRIGVPYLPERIDPLQLDEPIQRIILLNVLRGLAFPSEDGPLLLDVAVSATSEESGRRWVFELPPQQRFVSGRTLTAASVRASFNRYQELVEARRPTLDSPLLSPLRSLANIKTVEVQERRPPETDSGELPRLAITLHRSDPQFNNGFITLGIFDAALAAAFGDAFGAGTHFGGVGRYVVSERRADRITLESPSPLLPGAAHAAKRRATLVVYQNIEQLLRAVRSGTVDIVPLTTFRLLQATAPDSALLQLSSPLLELGELHAWKPHQSHWSRADDDDDKLLVGTILLRRDLVLDPSFRQSFQLYGLYDRSAVLRLVPQPTPVTTPVTTQGR